MQLKPAPSDAKVKAGSVFRWRALQLEKKRPVDLLDVDAAVLYRLGCVRQLEQFAGGGLQPDMCPQDLAGFAGFRKLAQTAALFGRIYSAGESHD